MGGPGKPDLGFRVPALSLHSTRTLLALSLHSPCTQPMRVGTVYLSVWALMCARLGGLLLLNDPLRSRRILSPAEGMILVLDYFIFFQHFFRFRRTSLLQSSRPVHSNSFANGSPPKIPQKNGSRGRVGVHFKISQNFDACRATLGAPSKSR